MNESPQVLHLWPEADFPAAQEIEYTNPDVDNWRFLRNVTVPTLTAFLPEPAISTGAAMIVCPGGAMHILAIDYEGLDVARWLCQRGIAAFVLKYRLLPTPIHHDEYQSYIDALMADLPRLAELSRQHTPTLVADGQRALQMVRERAAEWNLAPERVGMVGFSAGAYLTVATTLQAEASNRPDFVASIYGAMWGNLSLTGPLPPLFVALADDDWLGVDHSLHLYSAWHQANSPAELHLYAQGGHGFAMRKLNPAAEGWIDRMYEWMQVMGFVRA